MHIRTTLLRCLHAACLTSQRVISSIKIVKKRISSIKFLYPSCCTHYEVSTHSPYSAVLLQHQRTVFSSHITPPAASSHQTASSVFLSHYSSSSLQHQHSEQGNSMGRRANGRGF